MKILFYFGHPAQYLFLRETIRGLSRSEKHKISILIKTKDVLEQLIVNDGFAYTNILPQVRGKSKLSIAISILKRSWAMLPILFKIRPDLMIGSDVTIAQLGKFLSINRITITEDDYGVVKSLCDITYPFTQTILCPEVCQVGKWGSKKVGYAGYMKLGYLHPNVFKAQEENIREKYSLPSRFILLRLSQLDAHHDFGIKGISLTLLDNIIMIAKNSRYRVFISSEGSLEAAYKSYRLVINPSDMHQVLALASVLVSDSQSMTMEAAMLGTPSLRYSGFVGRISVLEELQHTYELTVGIPTGNEDQLLSELEKLLGTPRLRETYQDRRKAMLAEKIDVTAFLLWFIQHYPASKKTMQRDPYYQEKFQHN